MNLSFNMPANACNSHLHIIDPTFPNDGKAASQEGTIAQYQTVANNIGMPRAIFVQAKPFALDNSCLVDAIQKFGINNCRGIAVVNNQVSDAKLEELNISGIRGIRFSVWNPANSVVSINDCLPLSNRIKDMGWNIQLHMSAAQLLEHSSLLLSLDCNIVIDHMGRMNPALGTADPAYSFICKLIDRGNTWIKLSGPYLNTADGTWDKATETAKTIAAYAPERVVFGTDWPHVTEKIKPDEITLVNLIDTWLPTEKSKQLALVDNPNKLYFY